ncbi:MAG TPA: TonB-dependent receptor, partial [Acidobacteriaceae bacterium]|nr:TonB-dependent receptor [Acidobacteriaceae bacterium]
MGAAQLRLLGSALLLLLAIPGAHAQAIYGSITGTIVDPSGAVISGATVTVTDVSKGTVRAEKSNESGVYYVHNLIPDPYLVKIDAPGFKTAESATLTVSADRNVVFDVRLVLGAGVQTVEVTATAPQLTTDRAEVATTLDEKTIVQTPNLDRNVTALVYLAPGTAPGYFTNAPAEDPMRSVMVSANGQRPQSAGFVLDGADDKDGFIGEIVLNPPLDSVQESKFVSQDYDPEFGASVAGVTVMQTKSGTNHFHGSAYEFRHSDANLARDPFTQYPGSGGINPDIPHTMYNKFGGTVGGPVLKEKLFFFGAYEGTRSKQGNSMQLTVPTAKVQNTCGVSGQTYCDLSQYLAASPKYQIYKPFTGQTTTVNGVTYYTGNGNKIYTGNLIPNADLNNSGSIAAIKFMNLIPKPNVNVAADPILNNFLASGSGIYNFNQYDVRIDHQLKSNIHLFGRWGYLGSTQGSPAAFGPGGGPGFGAGGWAGTETGDNQSMAIGADIPIRPNLLTDIRFGWMHYAFVSAKYDEQDALMTRLGWAGLNTLTDDAGGASAVYFSDDSTGLTSWGTSNGGGLHCNCPLNETQNEYQIVNNWTRDAGRHSIKFGGDVRMLRQLRIPSDDNRAGEFTFYADQTSNPANATAGGLSLATYPFGNPGQMVRYYSSSTDAMDIQPRAFFYVGDTWRVTDKLTLSLGGRWQIIWPEHTNKAGNGGFWNWESDMIQVAGVGKVNLQGNVLNNYSYLEPRIGIAYRITPKSVIRAGIGRDADPGFWGDTFGQLLTQTIPVLQAQSFSVGNGLKTDAARNLSNNSIYNIANAPDAPST